MKQLTCEMCGSTDLIKQDGVFVCQSCGTRYSIEEAKKMMVEGTVDVTGSTVKVDTSAELANLYQLARRAKDDDNSENATKYYDMILLKDPTSWEASFYVVYFKAISCKKDQIFSAGRSVMNCIDSVLTLIKDHVDSKEEQINAVEEVASRCTTISDMLYNAAISLVSNCITSAFIMYKLGSSVNSLFGDYEELNETATIAWKMGVSQHSRMLAKVGIQPGNDDTIMEVVRMIQKNDSNYHMPTVTVIKASGGCYVATAVYGSYDCPQVWTLRRYRDYTLAETWYGRAFIRIYYAISPTLVKLFGHTEWFKKMWKGKLDRMVANLNAEGVEDTPYQDRNW